MTDSCKSYRDYIQIPCGSCIGCRLDYSRQWADRCLLEMQYHRSSYFVTLTYDDFHTKKSYYCPDDDNGCAVPVPTLDKRDLQLFFKRLRKATGQDIRYFAAGEYGSTTARPHYHCIIFGLELNDLIPYKKSHEGFQYYTSELLSRCWSHFQRDDLNNVIPDSWSPIGFAVAAQCTWETCAYTARYCTKKAFGQGKEFYETFNLEPEFTLMSRCPGIGRQYYEDHKDTLYKFDSFSVSTPKGGKQLRPPRYFDRLYDLEEPDIMSGIKDHRKEVAEGLQKMRLQQTGLSYLELLASDEKNKIASIRSLKRGDL